MCVAHDINSTFYLAKLSFVGLVHTPPVTEHNKIKETFSFPTETRENLRIIFPTGPSKSEKCSAGGKLQLHQMEASPDPSPPQVLGRRNLHPASAASRQELPEKISKSIY